MLFRVELDIFRGPLDLLLYLVRKHELDIAAIPIALITEQYLAFLEILQQIDINAVGEFLDMASTLIEIKSRLVLPQVEEETTAEVEDPREELVQRLLDYKKFRDAASLLEEQSRGWQQRYPRLANDLPGREMGLAEQPIQQVEMWDLVSAFGRIVRDLHPAPTSNIVYDDTPIHVHMRRLFDSLVAQQRTSLSEMFAVGMHKTSMIGVFLAILELVRHHKVRCEQDDVHGEIWVLPAEGFDGTLDISEVDDYRSRTYDESMPVKPR